MQISYYDVTLCNKYALEIAIWSSFYLWLLFKHKYRYQLWIWSAISNCILWKSNWLNLYGHGFPETGLSSLDALTHLPLVPHICISELCQHWFRLWLVAYSAPNHYLNQCWVIVNWTLRNKLQWNFNYQNTKFFIHKNASENIICKTAAILSRGRWINSYHSACYIDSQ